MKRILLYILLIPFSYSYGQQSWLYENSYFEGKQILEAYDGGTLILANDEGFFGPTKLFKLDKTGDKLWEHTFEENVETLPLCMAEDSQGNIIVGGKTFRYPSNSSDGFLIKLTPCGEVLWYKAMIESNEGIAAKRIVLDFNDNIIIAEYNGDINNGEYYEDTTLKKYSPNGELLFSSVLLPESDSDPKRVITCADGGYLVESIYYLPPYYDPSINLAYARAALVKTDSLGNVEWRNVYRWEQDTPDTIYGSFSGASVIELADGSFITEAAKRGDANFRPDLYRVSAAGETIWSTDVSEDNRTYQNGRMVLDVDSNLILAINVAEGNSNYEDAYLEIYKFNLQGDELARWQCPQETSILRDLRWNTDSTSLYVLPGSKISPNGTWSLYGFKFNTQSMQLDTFASIDNTVYDYYCPEGVIDLNFEFPEIGIQEFEDIVQEQLRIQPNPARNITSLYFDIANFDSSACLEIHSMQGQLWRSYSLQAAQGKVEEDLGAYPKGVYIVSILVNDRLVESRKLVVE